MNRPPLRRVVLAGAVIAGLLTAPAPASAGGPIWLRMAQATNTAFDNLHPAMATYRNHAYMLSVGMDTKTDMASGVYFTTNESGAWVTKRLTTQGPNDASLDDRTSMAIDPSTRTLYAAWVRNPSADSSNGCCSSVVLWTRNAAGAWSGPTEIYTNRRAIKRQPASIVAAGDKAYVAFIASGVADPCATHTGDDVVLTTYDGSNWSAPRNLTSCVAGSNPFLYPKLALDNGHLYLVSAVEDNTWDLWYADNASGAWSRPVQLTHNRIGTSTPGFGGEYSPFDYAIATSNGTAYIAYTQGTQAGTSASDVFLATRPPGGLFHVTRVTTNPAGAARFNLDLVARAGRLGLSYVDAGLEVQTPHVLTGTPGHFVEGGPGGPSRRRLLRQHSPLQ